MLTDLIMTRSKYLKEDSLISHLECFCHHLSQTGRIGLGPFSSMQPDRLRCYFILESWLRWFQPSRFSISIVHQRQRDVLLTMEKCKRRKVGENSSLHFITAFECNSFAPDIRQNVPVLLLWHFGGSHFLQTTGDWHYSLTAGRAQELSWTVVGFFCFSLALCNSWSWSQRNQALGKGNS